MPQLFGEGYITLKTLLTGQSGALFDGTLFEGMIGNNSYFIVIFLPDADHLQGDCHGTDHRERWRGRHLCPCPFCGWHGRGHPFQSGKPVSGLPRISENNFALVGMAGVMAGVMHAPLTAIFLIAEITGGYTLFIPLIVTATLSYVTILAFERQSIYTMRLAQRGELMTHHKDKNVLVMLSVEDVLEKDFKKVDADGHLGDLVKAISKSKRNLFPVVNEEKELMGIISLDDVRDIIFHTELYDKTTIREIMHLPPAIIRQ